LIKERRKTEFGRPTVQSVDRSLDVLEALAQRATPTGISELAQLVGLHVSTVHRLLATLVDRGYVRQDPESSRYHLGSRVFALAAAAELHLDLRNLARPFLERLMRGSGETANLATQAEGDVVYLEHAQSPRLVRMTTQPGARAPMYCTSVGKAMLAFGERELIERVIAGPMPRRTKKTIVSPERLRAELVAIAHKGYAVDDEEAEEGVRCIAAPVFDRRGGVIGSVSISGPTTRVTPQRVDELAPLICRIAKELSKQLGYGVVAESLLAVAAAGGR